MGSETSVEVELGEAGRNWERLEPQALNHVRYDLTLLELDSTGDGHGNECGGGARRGRPELGAAAAAATGAPHPGPRCAHRFRSISRQHVPCEG